MTLALNDGYVRAVATADDQTDFDFDFRLFLKTDLVVKVNGLELAQAAFEVTGLGALNGGTVTLDTGVDEDTVVEMISETAATRPADYPQAGGFKAVTVNADFDRQRAISRDQWREAQRSLKAPYGEEMTDLPAAADRASKFASYDAAGDPAVSALADLGVLPLTLAWGATVNANTSATPGASTQAAAAAPTAVKRRLTNLGDDAIWLNRGAAAAVDTGIEITPLGYYEATIPTDAEDLLAWNVASPSASVAYSFKQKVIT